MTEYVIVMDKKYIGYPLYKSKGCRIVSPYSLFPESRILRKIRSVLYKYNKQWTIGINKKLGTVAQTYILYDSINPVIAAYIRKKNPTARIIVFYINPEKYSYPYEEYQRSKCEIWTFDENDSKMRGVPWNPLHYFGVKKDTEHEKCIDAYFVGADKGRYAELKQLENKLIELGLKTKFIITPTSDFPIYNKKKYQRRLKYSENIEHILRSKSVIDIMQPGQTGYTMRIPEAMVNHVKLITNNQQISKYGFYHPTNIFILGKDDINNIYEFVMSPWNSDVNNEIRNLEFEYWLRKFGVH